MIEPVFMRATRQGANFIVVLIMLVVIFRTQITAIVNNAFAQINSGAGKINSNITLDGGKK
ncbi:MAG: Flp1 family type IVb pilin [Eubacteriales bacterium]|nr:Flp1 family type IVb pilin [Eubacteriales bacterium]